MLISSTADNMIVEMINFNSGSHTLQSSQERLNAQREEENIQDDTASDRSNPQTAPMLWGRCKTKKTARLMMERSDQARDQVERVSYPRRVSLERRSKHSHANGRIYICLSKRAKSVNGTWTFNCSKQRSCSRTLIYQCHRRRGFPIVRLTLRYRPSRMRRWI